MRGEYENHPGFEAGDCPLRLTIKPHAFGMSSRGFACSSSGGHCIPNKHCKARVDEHKKEASNECTKEDFDDFLLWRPELA